MGIAVTIGAAHAVSVRGLCVSRILDVVACVYACSRPTTGARSPAGRILGIGTWTIADRLACAYPSQMTSWLWKGLT